MSVDERKELVKIGKELHELTKDDIKFILDERNNETQVYQRMTTARHRMM